MGRPDMLALTEGLLYDEGAMVYYWFRGWV